MSLHLFSLSIAPSLYLSGSISIFILLLLYHFFINLYLSSLSLVPPWSLSFFSVYLNIYLSPLILLLLYSFLSQSLYLSSISSSFTRPFDLNLFLWLLSLSTYFLSLSFASLFVSFTKNLFYTKNAFLSLESFLVFLFLLILFWHFFTTILNLLFYNKFSKFFVSLLCIFA